MKKVIERVIEEKKKMGQMKGPIILDEKGWLHNSSDMDTLMHELLERFMSKDESLFPLDIQTIRNLYESYHSFCLFRRASDTRDVKMKVAAPDIETVNRQGKEQRAKTGDKVNMSMRQHYTQPKILVEPFVRYTSAM